MRNITEGQIEMFTRHMEEEERAPATVKMYVRNVEELAAWLAGRTVTKELAVAWKEHLLSFLLLSAALTDKCRLKPGTIKYRRVDSFL